VFEQCDFTLLLPQFHVVAINKLFGFFFCGGVILAIQIEDSKEVAVRSDNVCTVMRHETFAELGGSAKTLCHRRLPRLGR
jgi:hypothetical protein